MFVMAWINERVVVGIAKISDGRVREEKEDDE